MKVTFHSGNLSQPLFPIIEKYFNKSKKLDVAVGFLTVAGMEKILELVSHKPEFEEIRLVFGAATHPAIKAVTLAKASSKFTVKFYTPYVGTRKSLKFATMMHSKVYIFKNSLQRYGIVGSSNLTEFALTGKNVEASNIVEGTEDEDYFSDLQTHFNSLWDGAIDVNLSHSIHIDTLSWFLLGNRSWSYPEVRNKLAGWLNNDKVTTRVTVNCAHAFQVSDLLSKTLAAGDIISYENPIHILYRAKNMEVLIHIGGTSFIHTTVKALSIASTSSTHTDYCDAEISSNSAGVLELRSIDKTVDFGSKGYIVLKVESLLKIDSAQSIPSELSNISTQKHFETFFELSSHDLIKVDKAKISSFKFPLEAGEADLHKVVNFLPKPENDLESMADYINTLIKGETSQTSYPPSDDEPNDKDFGKKIVDPPITNILIQQLK
jgi:HKD family nuclease